MRLASPSFLGMIAVAHNIAARECQMKAASRVRGRVHASAFLSEAGLSL